MGNKETEQMTYGQGFKDGLPYLAVMVALVSIFQINKYGDYDLMAIAFAYIVGFTTIGMCADAYKQAEKYGQGFRVPAGITAFLWIVFFLFGPF